MQKLWLARTRSVKGKSQARSRWTSWAVSSCLAVAIAALIVVVIIQSGSKAAAGAPAVARVGSPAPDFTLRLFKGESIRLSSLKGKPILVNFWHSS